MKYRLDIQILRGIAVIYVVLFHLGLHQIKNGFLGVDVFFIISGFLMAALYKESNAKDFFARRAKRLLPSYYMVIFATLLISFLINTPNETNQVVSQAIFGSTFLSNVGFWLQNSYFSKSEYNPLLHLWSLGVEIQFYIAVPVLAYIFKKAKFLLILILLSSIILCFFVLTISPKTAFFMMPLRMWEFLLGYGSALFFTKNGNIKTLKFSHIGVTGLFLILLIPFFKIDGQALDIVHGHPGLASLLISIATCMVLVFGLPATVKNNVMATGLAKLGKYSYSIYLVHFPVIVLYLSEPFRGTVLDIPSVMDWFIILILITIISVLLHKLIETRNFNIGIAKISIISATTILALAIILPPVKNLFISDKEIKIFNAFKDRSTYRCGKIFRIINPISISCELSNNITYNNSGILLVGDSHADSIKTMFAKIAENNKTSTYFIVQNNPLTSGLLAPKNIVTEAKQKRIDHIVVHFSPGGINFDRLSELVALSQKNNIRVSFIDPVPIWPVNIPKEMYSQLKGSGTNPQQTKEEYMSTHEDFFSNINKIKSYNFQRLSVVDFFCNPNCIYQNKEGIPLYFDEGHLTLTGSKVLEKVFNQACTRNQ